MKNIQPRYGRILSLITIFALFTSPSLIAQNPEANPQYEPVYSAVKDYVLALYNAESYRIERSVDTSLHKVGYYDYNGESFNHIPMSYDELYTLSETWNAEGNQDVEEAPQDIVIYDIFDKTASARLTAKWGIDFIHLAKVDGVWKIKNIIWQSKPKKEGAYYYFKY